MKKGRKKPVLYLERASAATCQLQIIPDGRGCRRGVERQNRLFYKDRHIKHHWECRGIMQWIYRLQMPSPNCYAGCH